MTARLDDADGDAPDRHEQGDLIARTLALWQPRTKRTLTDEDAVEMIGNMVGFITTLRAWAAVDTNERAA
jgi:hypothetical protein